MEGATKSQKTLRKIFLKVSGPPETRDIIAQTIGLGSGKQWDKLEYIGEKAPDPRLGELIKQEQEAGRLATSKTGRPKKPSNGARLFTLKDYGLTWSDSERAQRVAEHHL